MAIRDGVYTYGLRELDGKDQRKMQTQNVTCESSFPVIYKSDNIGIIAQLLMEINWK